MLLTGKVQEALTGNLGFDTAQVIDAAHAKMFAQRYTFCLRYIPHSGPPGPLPDDLSFHEANDILDAGLALMPVQHAHKADGGWTITKGLGRQDGELAATSSETIGFPKGICVWCDLEGLKPITPHSDVIEYCNDWAAAVQARAYLPGLYVGYQCILDMSELSGLHFNYFWRSQSRVVPNVNPKGFQLIQLFPEIPVNGLSVDINVTQMREKSDSLPDSHLYPYAYWLVR